MAWDSSRPVPWQRLVKEWLLYVGIMGVLFVLFFRDRGLVGALAGLLVSGPLYLGVGYVLAKLGYQRKTLKGMSTPQASEPGSSTPPEPSTSASAQRGRPAPTKRTSTGINRPKAKRRRR